MVKLTFRIWILIIALIFATLMIAPSFKSGVVIKSVENNSTAFNEGLRAGMIIQQVNGNEIETVNDYSSLITSVYGENSNATKKVTILTDKGEYVLFSEKAPEITAGKLPRSRIKTGLDLSGGARALVRPVNVSLSQSEINDLVTITSQRLNAFGITDVNVRAVRDLEGNNYMLVEIAGATPADLRELVGKQGKFEAKVGNETVFEGGERDIADVCRNDATCAAVTDCLQTPTGFACNFMFTLYLTQEAAQKHAGATRNLAVDSTGQYLSEKLYLYVDDIEVDSLLIGKDLRGQVTTQISIQGSGEGATQEDAYNDAKAQMNKLQTVLITGSLPYKLEIVKLDNISPFLGEEFTRAIIMLGLVVFSIISLALFVKYRKIKITLSVILTMFSEVFITLGIAALINWNLDAPSIAGIIAGMGTGVNDQIVIIDEAVSEESGSSGENVKQRIKRALFIIIGAFCTIVAAMLPLFWAGAGLLRGFALTTIIGVSVGILITRPAFADILKKIVE